MVLEGSTILVHLLPKQNDGVYSENVHYSRRSQIQPPDVSSHINVGVLGEKIYRMHRISISEARRY